MLSIDHCRRILGTGCRLSDDELEQRLLDAFIYKQAISQETFQEQSNRLETEISSLRIQINDGQADDLDVEAVLEFARYFVAHAAEFALAAPLDQRQRFQRVLCAEGIPVSE